MQNIIKILMIACILFISIQVGANTQEATLEDTSNTGESEQIDRETQINYIKRLKEHASAVAFSDDPKYWAILREGLLAILPAVANDGRSFQERLALAPPENLAPAPDLLDSDALQQRLVREMLEKAENGERIIGGSEVVRFDQFLETVALSSDGFAFCTGVYVGEGAVLTATHCLCYAKKETRSGHRVRIEFGLALNDGRTQNRPVDIDASSAFNASYCNIQDANPSLVGCVDDVALVRFRGATPIFDTAGTIRPGPPKIFVRTSDIRENPSRRYAIVGFGLNYRARVFGPNPPPSRFVKRAAYLSGDKSCRSRRSACNTTEFDCLPASQFMLGDTLRDTCHGDSGGPAYVDGRLAGIVSRAAPATEHERRCGFGTVYSAVTPELVTWLQNKGINLESE